MARKKFEGSPKDKREDKFNSKRLGMTLKAYEKSDADKRADREGQRKLDAKNKVKRK